MPRVTREHAGTDERPVQSRLFNHPFQAFSNRPCGVGLLKKWMRRLERRGEVDDPPRLLRDSLDRTFDRVRRRDPHQEHGVDLLQAGIETLGNREIPAHDVDICRQMCSVRISGHGAKLGARRSQLIDHVTPDVSSGAGDEDPIQWLTSLVPPPREID